MVQRVKNCSLLRKIVAVIAFTATIFSCDNNKVDLLEGFDKPIELPVHRTIENVFLKTPFGILVRDSIIIAWDSTEGKQVSVYSTSDGRLLSGFLNVGRGPGEALHVDDMYIKKDTLYAATYPEQLYSYSLDDLLGMESVVPNSVYEYGGVFNPSGITAFSKNNGDERNTTMYRTAGFNGGSLLFWGIFPEDDPLDYPLTDFSKQLAYQGHFFVPENIGKALYLFDTYAIGFDILDMDNLTVEHHFYRYPQVKMDFYPEFEITSVDYADKYQPGFKSASANDSGFYLLYEDKELFQGCYILSFDWESTPRKLFHVSESLSDICIDSNNHYLYAVSGEETIDGVGVLVYTIEE